MRLDYAFLAKFADLAQDGTLAVIGGGFDSIVVDQFPLITGPLALIVRLRFQPDECEREHVLRVDLFLGDTRLPFELEARLNPVRDRYRPDHEIGFTYLVNTVGIQLPEHGDYEFRLTVDGVGVGGTSLSLVQQAVQPQQAAPQETPR